MILFSHKFGQLGNRLFAFAHLIANAAANDTTVVNLSFDEYARYFRGTRGTVCRYPITNSIVRSTWLRSILFLLNKGALKLLRKTRMLRSPLHRIIVADLPEYKLGENKFYPLGSTDFQNLVSKVPIVFLFGRFFRDYSNFDKYQDVIRDYFTPTNVILQHVNQLVAGARENSDLLVGVHIRRGDYSEFMHGKYFYSHDQYLSKMLALKNQVHEKKIVYIVCSNEPIAADLFASINVRVGSGDPVEDMYLLAQCDFIMGPPSTFSSWASFWGKKPLYQMKDIDQPISFQNFLHLPPESLYNF